MYELVKAADRYPEFLPWCRSAQIISETETTMEASIEMARGVLNKSFSTRNTMEPGRRIDLQLRDGPFKKLQGFWQFDPLKTENACKISLKLEFEFDSAMFSIAARPVFTQIANSLVDAFCKRAVEIYGERI